MSVREETERSVWRRLLVAHPLASAIILLCALTLAALLAQGLQYGDTEKFGKILLMATIGGTVAFLATAVGTLPAFLLHRIPQQVEDIMLGFSAGMMLSATAFSLLLPGLRAGVDMTGNTWVGSLIVVFGMFLGVFLMQGLEHIMPHRHEITGVFGKGSTRFNRVWLFVFAITLHNLPEGMAIGVGFSRGDVSVGLPLTIAIALQDIPEGLAVAIALRGVGMNALKAVMIGSLTGAMELLGALLGVGLTGGFALSYPIGLGVAGGAMLFVVSHEVIPETHRNGHQTLATIGLIAGFALMMILDTMLG
ncbi:MAG: ZIP family metal transporter [Burkholderiaceae bacterium]|jgi:ZIP family zinc transporter|nr:ZIP family metal transporter [Burkholderiaceae bacterium]